MKNNITIEEAKYEIARKYDFVNFGCLLMDTDSDERYIDEVIDLYTESIQEELSESKAEIEKLKTDNELTLFKLKRDNNALLSISNQLATHIESINEKLQ